jgi:hypothetical protein
MQSGLFGIIAGRNKNRALAPIWESTTTVLSLTSFHQVTHNLNFFPKLWSVHLRPVVTDAGWTANLYEIPATGIDAFDGVNYKSLQPYVTANAIGVGYAGTSFHVWNGAGVFAALTPGNWRVIYRIFG